MYNMTFHARGLALQFDANGNVNMDYDLKLWVWQDPRPELRTVGVFDGRLKLWRSQLSWHTPGNQVSPPHPGSSSSSVGGTGWGDHP